MRLPDLITAELPVSASGSLAETLGIGLMPRPGAVLEHRGVHFYYCTERRTILRLQPVAALTLAGLLGGWTLEQIESEATRRSLEFGQHEALALVAAFVERGLLRTPPPGLLDRSIDAMVTGLLQHEPMRMMLFMAQSCNLRCKYCYGIEGNYEDRGQRMSAETARAAVDYLLTRGHRRSHFSVYFFGGEPLLNFQVLRSTVEYAKRATASTGKTVSFGVTTNGTLLTPDICDFLVSEDFQVVVSLDGDAAAHNVNRPTKGGGGSFSSALAGFQRLKSVQRRPDQVKIRATMSHQNHDFERIAGFFESSGLGDFGIGSALTRACEPQPTDLTPADLESLDHQFEKVLDRLVRELETRGVYTGYNPFFKGVIGMSQAPSTPSIGCGISRNDQGIGVDGSIYPCHRYVGMQPWVIGNVRDGISESSVRRVYSDFFAMWMRHCAGCWARYACSGACAWQHSSSNGSFVDPRQEQCAAIRRSLRRSAWLALHLAEHHPRILAELTDGGHASGGCCGRNERSSGCSQPA